MSISLVLVLVGCPSSSNSPVTWKIYHNPRYHFEFPFPSNWIASPMPDNRDGRAFRDPQNAKVEIRGWASARLPIVLPLEDHDRENFTTRQGLTGNLLVEVNSDFSSMKLTLGHEQLIYHWQGRSPSQEFPSYYRFFYYVASEFRVPLRKNGDRIQNTQANQKASIKNQASNLVTIRY